MTLINLHAMPAYVSITGADERGILLLLVTCLRLPIHT